MATRVARAAGLKDPAGAANAHRSKGLRGFSLERLMAFEAMSLPKEPNGSYNAEESTNPIAMGPFGSMNTGGVKRTH